MRTSIQTIAAAAAFVLSLAAHADTVAGGSRAITRGRSAVYYGDLDIATEQGAKIMLLRIEQAARKACGGRPTFSSYTGSLDNTFETCCDRAVERTVNELGAPTVARIYADSASRRCSRSS